jgi:2-dehydro-3-deoxyphosphogluconate aldolase/(4S)-4-hydroxy-2-oxoglutarate aldolase
MSDNQEAIAEILGLAPVVPVLIIDDVEKAIPLARTLVAGGLLVLEVTLRMPGAINAIRRITTEIPRSSTHRCRGGGGLHRPDLRAAVLASAAVRKAGSQIACSLRVLTNRSMTPLQRESPSCRIQACGRPDHAPGSPRAITTMFG